MKNELFNTLPTEVQEKAKNILKAYDEVHITFENGNYNVGAGISLRNEYPNDFRVIGDYKANEIFTEEERIINYVESFHDYPRNYKGKRDYSWLRTLTSWDDKVKFDEFGNLVTV